MKKTYIIDTNVLIQAPHALMSFEDNDIVLPISVLEELDKHKNADGEKGANARNVIRALDKLRLCGPLTEGVSLEGGGTLRLQLNCSDVKLPDTWDAKTPDNRILKICKHLNDIGKNAIIVTNDIILRIKADTVGVKAEEFTTDRSPEIDKQYKGRIKVWVPDEILNEFKITQQINPDSTYLIQDDEKFNKIKPMYTENQFIILVSDTNPKKTILGKYQNGSIVPLLYDSCSPFGVKPRNVGQKFVQESLIDNNVPLVIIKGAAGTAKTFYSLAVGLSKVMETSPKEYRKILICRPSAEFDDDIGFLPGNEQEKISPLLRPIRDNLEILVDGNEEHRYEDEELLSGKIEELFEREIVTAQALNFIRGRSIVKTWLIIDEAQNLTPKQAKGIITRAGKDTKIILVGDPEQIDNHLLDERTNGLSYASEKMKGSKLCYQVTMNNEECERSLLAMDAANRM